MSPAAEYIDVTVRLAAGIPVYPGNPEFELQPIKRIADGGSSNVSKLVLGTHTGTHVDAPKHFIDDGATADQLPLDVLIGPARVIEIATRGITEQDLAAARVPQPGGEARHVVTGTELDDVVSGIRHGSFPGIGTARGRHDAAGTEDPCRLHGHLAEGDHLMARWQRRFETAFDAIREQYRNLLALAMSARRLFVIAFLAVVVVSFVLVPFLGRDFFPSVDAGEMTLHVRLPPGTRIENMTQTFAQVEALPLYRYQLRLRLARALDRLADVDDLAQLGLELGFSSHSHFSAAFQQAYGRSPSEFRDAVIARRQRKG